MPATCQTKGNMMHDKRNHDVPCTPSSVSKQDGSAQKRPRSFYSSSIKTWASKHSELGGNADGSGTKTGVGRCDVIRDSSRQAAGDGRHRGNGFGLVIDCETASDKSSTCAEKCAGASTEGINDCDVVISDSEDDLFDSQRVQGPQKARKAKSNLRSKSAKCRSKVRNQMALPPSAKVASKTTSDNRRSLDPPRLVLEVDSDDDNDDDDDDAESSKSAKYRSKVRNQKALPPSAKVASKTTFYDRQSLDPPRLVLEVDSDHDDDDDDDAESSVNVAPSLKSLDNNVDVSSCKPPANTFSQVRSPVIEIDSDSSSSIRDNAPLQTKSSSSVKHSALVQTLSSSSLKNGAPSQAKSCSSVRDSAPSQTNALQNHSVSLNIENKHLNNTTTLSLPTSSQRNPPTGQSVIGLPKTRAAPNYQGVFQNYCGNDNPSASAASHLSNGGAQSSISGDSYANGAIGANTLNQEQVLAYLKSGKFSLQFIAGIPVLSPINFPPVNLVALPFGGSGLQPNMKTIGSIYSTPLQTNTVGYGAVPGSAPTTSSANAVGHGAQRLTLASDGWRSVPGSQSSSFGARNGGQTLPKANLRKTIRNMANFDVGNRDKTKIIRKRKRTSISTDSPSKKASISTDSPSKKAKGKAATVDVSIDKDKDLSDKTKSDKDRTDKDSKNKPKRDSERPMAKALLSLATQLVSKQVIVGLIKITKKTVDKKPEDEQILTKLQNRHAELKCGTEAFELKTKECNCGRFKTESSNILLEHLQHGSSTRSYRCCFCLRMTHSHRTFRQHMALVHKISGSQKHDTPKSFLCSLCAYDTNHQPTFESHFKRCHSLALTGKNLHPGLDDFDIPISYEESRRRQIAKEVSLVANIGSKIDKYGQRSLSLGVSCLTCGKSVSSKHALYRHKRSAHRIPDPKPVGTLLKQTTPSKIPASNHKIPDPKSGGTPLKQTTPSKIPASKTPSSKKLSTDVGPQTAANTVKCCLCDEFLGSEMVQHFRVQHQIFLSTMAKKHFCYFCDCSLQNSKCFEEHMVSTHSDIFPNIKALWNRILASIKFKERDALIAYEASGNDGTTIALPWQCLVCKKRFQSSSLCYRHAMLFHTIPKVECQLCPKMIATGATYTRHLQQCHIRKCCVVIERLSLPYATTTPPKTKAAQLSCLPAPFINCDNKMDVELSENKGSSPEIKSPSVTSCN